MATQTTVADTTDDSARQDLRLPAADPAAAHEMLEWLREVIERRRNEIDRHAVSVGTPPWHPSIDDPVYRLDVTEFASAAGVDDPAELERFTPLLETVRTGARCGVHLRGHHRLLSREAEAAVGAYGTVSDESTDGVCGCGPRALFGAVTCVCVGLHPDGADGAVAMLRWLRRRVIEPRYYRAEKLAGVGLENPCHVPTIDAPLYRVYIDELAERLDDDPRLRRRLRTPLSAVWRFRHLGVAIVRYERNILSKGWASPWE